MKSNYASFLFAAAALMAAPAVFAADGDVVAGKAPPPMTPSLMTPTEIEAYNKGLPQTHPYYIKCRKELEIGSLVKKHRVCYTNEKWKEVIALGNQNARDTADAMSSKAANSN